MEKTDYKCDMCKRIFTSGWSDEEAIKECVELWGKKPSEMDCAIMCDDCFNKIHPKKPENKLLHAQAREEISTK